MAVILPFWILKGGPGKSKLSKEIAVKIAERGYRVLTCDFDQQADLTKSFGYKADIAELQYTSYEVLLNPEQNPREYAVIQTPFGVDLIPSTIEIRGAETRLAAEYARELRLKTALSHLQDDYDFIFLDPPPGSGIVVANILVAAHSIIVPLETRSEVWEKMSETQGFIIKLKLLNPDLHISGIVCNKVRHTKLSRSIEELARQAYGDLVFKTTVPDDARLAETYIAGIPIGNYAPGTMSDIALTHLAQEMEERYVSKAGR